MSGTNLSDFLFGEVGTRYTVEKPERGEYLIRDKRTHHATIKLTVNLVDLTPHQAAELTERVRLVLEETATAADERKRLRAQAADRIAKASTRELRAMLDAVGGEK